MLGASTDTQKLNDEFAEQQAIGFPLLSDPDGSACRQLGILSERGMAMRTTFLVAADATLLRVWEGVSIDGHAAEVLAAAKTALSKS